MRSSAIEQVFSRKTIRELAAGELPVAITGYALSFQKEKECWILGEGFSAPYKYLFRQHRGTLSTIKEPASVTSRLSHRSMFEVLRKKERAAGLFTAMPKEGSKAAKRQLSLPLVEFGG